MKIIILAIAILGSSISYADCQTVASKAAESIYPSNLGPVTDSQVEGNPLSVSSGSSLIVTLNPRNPQAVRKYLVLINSTCTEVGYVMSYIYVSLLKYQ